MSSKTPAEAEAAVESQVRLVEKTALASLVRLTRVTRSFVRTTPVDLGKHEIFDDLSAAKILSGLLARGLTRLIDNPGEQLNVSWRDGRH